VLDVRARFRHPPKAAVHTDHLILARAGPRLVAVRADRALEVVRVAADAVEPARTAAQDAGAIADAAGLPDGLVLVPDLRAFLTRPEGDALDGAMAARAGGGAA
jgi:purine-binding chemotaxis protein CheW